MESNKIHVKQVTEAAINGSWLLVSAKHFPTFWPSAKSALQALLKENKVQNSFRLIFDFQNYKLSDIPSDFLSSESAVFHMCPTNLEDMEGLNDVWAHILNDDLLTSIII